MWAWEARKLLKQRTWKKMRLRPLGISIAGWWIWGMVKVVLLPYGVWQSCCLHWWHDHQCPRLPVHGMCTDRFKAKAGGEKDKVRRGKDETIDMLCWVKQVVKEKRAIKWNLNKCNNLPLLIRGWISYLQGVCVFFSFLFYYKVVVNAYPGHKRG